MIWMHKRIICYEMGDNYIRWPYIIIKKSIFKYKIYYYDLF